jgi:hypothetical protein
VAKIDGYIISVAEAVTTWASKRLVRIEEVGRTSANARARGGHRRPDDEPLQSTSSRRRGRRGGRRRSRANGRFLMTYAIVKTGGKQYRVRGGQSLLVERCPRTMGAKVTLEPLLYRE